MKNNNKLIILFFLAIVVAILTFLKNPVELGSMLHNIASETRFLAVTMHFIYIVLLLAGLLNKKKRNLFFSLLLLVLSGTASIISIIYLIPPNIIIFVTFFILTFYAFMKKEICFDLAYVGSLGRVIGVTALITGFYYLHWVDAPIWINAFMYSPLGIVNCPTMVAFCGLIIFMKPSGVRFLEFFVSLITLYFGFFGIMRLGAYIDIVLIVSGAYLLVRQASLFDNKQFYRKYD